MFPDGDTINIPSIGQAQVLDYVEGDAVRYTAMDTGNFTLTVDQYKHSGTYITNKMKQDSYLMSQLVSSFVPAQARAIQVAVETRIFERANAGQTASDLNVINGARHRWVGSGTSPANDIIALKDFVYAKYALDKANVPAMGRVAIVDPSVEVALNTLTNIVNVSNNPNWEGILPTGLNTGMRFSKSIYGFDVYVSNYLPSGISETINSNSVTNGVANLFFSTAPEVVPIVGIIRQPATVESKYNMDLQRDEYVTIMRYAFKLFRPENMVIVITDAGSTATYA